MSMEMIRQVVALNQKISDNNDRFVHEFKAILEKLNAGREQRMQLASLLQGMPKEAATNSEK